MNSEVVSRPDAGTIVRTALVILAVLAVSYPAATGLARAVTMHGRPDPTPKPWPLGPGGAGEEPCQL